MSPALAICVHCFLAAKLTVVLVSSIGHKLEVDIAS